jgi:hypothetical protein
VDERVVLERRHRHRDAHAVVGAERGTGGDEPGRVGGVEARQDRVAGEIVGRAAGLLRHHIEVGLQYDARRAFLAWAGRFPHGYVAGRIHRGLYALGLGPGHQGLSESALLVRRMRDRAYSQEMLED